MARELATRLDTSRELSVAGSTAKQQAEIQAAVVMARRYPRDEGMAIDRIKTACKRPAFADAAAYRYPRGKKRDGTPNMIVGPSINLAREMGRCFGNIRVGQDVLRDDDETRLIEAYAWDLETNYRTTEQVQFKKLIYRKKDGWVQPDERDLRELTNRLGAIAKRNCLLALFPRDVVDDCVGLSDQTLADAAKKNPKNYRERMVDAFAEIGITESQLSEYLAHSVWESTGEEIKSLGQIFTSIRDGHTKWQEYVKAAQDAGAPPSEGEVDPDTLEGHTESYEPSQGAGDPNPDQDKFLTRDQINELKTTALEANVSSEAFKELLGENGCESEDELRNSHFQNILDAIILRK